MHGCMLRKTKFGKLDRRRMDEEERREVCKMLESAQSCGRPHEKIKEDR
jgi:hypothetical protein